MGHLDNDYDGIINDNSYDNDINNGIRDACSTADIINGLLVPHTPTDWLKCFCIFRLKCFCIYRLKCSKLYVVGLDGLHLFY